MCGEEISKAISSLTQGQWHPNPGFIYPVLKKLSSFGYTKGEWVVRESKHPRFVYEITQEGKTYYLNLKEEWIEGLKEFVDILKLLGKEGM